MKREERTALATVCHELRTPLTSIRGYVETLLDEPTDAATARRFLQTVRREVLRLGRLVESLLDEARPHTSAAAAPRAIACDVPEQIRRAIEIVAPLAQRRRVTIRVRDASAATARVESDACVRAIANLIDNAVSHGRECGSVEISYRQTQRFVEITVDDDGVGISAQRLHEVFELGVRDGAHDGPRANRGIGLSIVKQIAQRAGGDVRAEHSPLLGGARFVLRLPSGISGTLRRR